jgi:pimeloyl-ACP methyl ester carboxylesterase
MPRSPQQISGELAQLLDEASPPFVFVGHSMGGHHVIGAALQRLDDTAAVILLDVPHPDFEEMRLTLLTPAERQQRRQTLLAGLTRAPQAVADERAGATEHPPTLVEGSLRDIPLTVVVADRQNFGPQGSQAAHRDLWISAAADFTVLSTVGRRVVAHGSGHMIHIEQPALVIDLVRAAVAAHR